MARLKIKRGLKANLPTLLEGELGYTTDADELYIGTAGRAETRGLTVTREPQP